MGAAPGAARPAFALPAALLLCAAAGCSLDETVELSPFDLAPPDLARRPFCPSRIDLYGAAGTLFAACGGLSMPAPSTTGQHDPAQASFAASLAGRLEARLNASRTLGGRFTEPFVVRACGTDGAWLSSLAPAAVDDECSGPDAPPVAPGVDGECRDAPAALLLLDGSEPFDRCHGGGNSAHADDPTTYAQHFALRLDALLAARSPSLALVGGQTEWTPLPGAAASAEACGWARGDWARLGRDRWRALHPGRADVLLVDDLHAAFKAHSTACCQALGLPCEAPDWLTAATGDAAAEVDCAGADALLDLWLRAVESALAASRFACDR